MPKILIVEDTKTHLNILTDMLKYRGYDVIFAYNADDGLKQVEREKPDLIIVDLLLAEHGGTMDGFDFIKSVRDVKKTSKVPIIARTGFHVSEEDEIRALRLGADDYVKKDISHGVLEARIEAHLRRHKNATRH